MGDPKFPRRSYDTPSHPWQGERIKAEAEIVRQYGLKNKTEVWKAQTVLRDFRGQSRELQARVRSGEAQAKLEADNLITKCARIGVLPVDGGTLNDILALTDVKILERRLQTIVYRKGLTNSMKQARQMIVHGHIYMNGHRVTVPGYIVTRLEESSIEYNPSSPYTDDMHPMRQSKQSNKKPYVPLEMRPREKRSPRNDSRGRGAPRDAAPAAAPAKDAAPAKTGGV
ncbi:MAG: 30S ribosomal protein S4 [Methanomassiliicoccaceae archaeon]|jgi:small subunit ribosomal protein S4|nr:30S ribosomal protein S4 [Methanomassiliicoccaceae archaeon]